MLHNASCNCLQHFNVETEDLSGILWSPDSRMLCVWESCLQVGFHWSLLCCQYCHSIGPYYVVSLVILLVFTMLSVLSFYWSLLCHQSYHSAGLYYVVSLVSSCLQHCSFIC